VGWEKRAVVERKLVKEKKTMREADGLLKEAVELRAKEGEKSFQSVG